MEKMDNDSESIISIGKEAKCEDFVINIPYAKWPECCIYRVPKQLRKLNKEAYTPKLVSIGPFHHRRKELRDMEMHKLKYFKDFFQRKTVKKNQKYLGKIIKDNEVKIRHCYSEDCKLNSEDFVKMILFDSIFIIELFLKRDDINEKKSKDKKAEEEAQREEGKKKRDDINEKKSKDKKAEEEPQREEGKKVEEEAQREGKKAEDEKYYIQNILWLENGIVSDLILLENQLPFFVLEELHTSAFCDSSNLSNHQMNQEETPFLKLSRSFFSRYDKQKTPNNGGEVKHFTDLLRYFFCPLELQPIGDQYNVYSATKLNEAGLQFKAVKDDRRLLDITFPKNKCLKSYPCFNLSWLFSCLPWFLKYFPRLEVMERFLEVPCFEVNDHTECVLRNLMALEQWRYPLHAYICNYVLLLDYLINTEQDVALLVDKEVIINMLGSNNAVAELINNLSNEIVLAGSCYSDLGKELNEYHDNPWNRNMASMTSVYFRDFWRGTATVVGLFILFFQFWDFLQSILEKKKKCD